MLPWPGDLTSLSLKEFLLCELKGLEKIILIKLPSSSTCEDVMTLKHL